MAHNLPPHNRDAEEALIGAIMIDPDALMRVRDTDLDAGDFYIERLGIAYAAAVHLHSKHEPVDMVTMADELERRE
jgi:replicative DNA helicase